MATKAAERALDGYWPLVVTALIAFLGLFMGILGVANEMKKDSYAATGLIFCSAWLAGMGASAFALIAVEKLAAAIRSMGDE